MSSVHRECQTSETYDEQHRTAQPTADHLPPPIGAEIVLSKEIWAAPGSGVFAT
jgi:hypothetical protein